MYKNTDVHYIWKSTSCLLFPNIRYSRRFIRRIAFGVIIISLFLFSMAMAFSNLGARMRVILCAYRGSPSGNLPHKVKNAVCALQINCNLLSFLLEKSCRNEQTINFLSYNFFSMGVDWKKNIARLNEVSAMLYKCTYCISTL